MRVGGNITSVVGYIEGALVRKYFDDLNYGKQPCGPMHNNHYQMTTTLV